MPLPRWLGRFNRVVTNRVARVVAGWVPGLGIVEHVGRRSGQGYRTPVNVYRREGGYTVALVYGSNAEWTKNVLAAGSASIVTRGRTHLVVNPRVVTDATRAPVPAPIRPILRLLDVDEFLFVDRESADG
jgi:deazaflavin-dependent oxidoreductase (nitroreductase family)